MGLRDRVRGKRTPQELFADEVASLVPQFVAVEKVEPGLGFSLQLTLANGKPLVFNLQNIFAESSRLDGPGRAELIRHAILAMVPSDRPQTWAAARVRVMPCLRAASWVAALTHDGRSPLRRVFAPHVLLLVAIDDEHGMSFVTAEDTGKWGVGWTELIGAAMVNLTKTPPPVAEAERGSGLDVLGPDGYESSWLAAPSSLERAARTLWGEFVVVAPSRDTLRLIAVGDYLALARELESLREEYLTEPRYLSPVPFVVRAGQLFSWNPSPDHPCRNLVDRLHGTLATKEYGVQTNILAGMMQRLGEDVFIGEYRLVEWADSSVWSWACWLRHVTDGLLPKADFLCLRDLQAHTDLWVRWHEAARVARDSFWEEPGYYPPRWRTRGWPDGPTMATLRSLAVDPTTDERLDS